MTNEKNPKDIKEEKAQKKAEFKAKLVEF